MASFLIGVAVTTCFFLIRDYAVKNNIVLSWWKWGITVLGLFMTTLMLATIAAFWGEGAVKATIMTSSMMVTVLIIMVVLMKRFIFSRNTSN